MKASTKITLSALPPALWVASVGALVVTIYFALFAPFIPVSCAPLASDYAQFFTWLADGALWFWHNGPFAVPWFTPPFCGGLPKFAHPHSMYYSLPQLLTLLASPAQAIRWTLLIFAALGFAGAYHLARRAFALNRPAALLVATLFTFNGFVAHRLIAGHLRYHAFMLLPGVASALLPGRAVASRQRWLAEVSLAAAGLAYALYSGMVAELLGFGLGLLMLLLLHDLLKDPRRPSPSILPSWLPRLAGATALSLAIGAAQLSASFSYVALFGRQSYRLPGIPSLLDLWGVLSAALFFPPADELVRHSAVNMQWLIERHELEYGVTWVPAILLAIWALASLPRATNAARPAPSSRALITGAGLALLLALPLAANYYSPGWNALLKSLPVLGSASLLFRLFIAYIPLLCVLAGLAVERARWLRPHATLVSAIAMLCVLAINCAADRDSYRGGAYDGRHLCQRLKEIRDGGELPRINRIVAGGGNLSAAMNSLVDGASILNCYDPMLGYQLEQFPRGDLQAGPVREVINGHYNLKNPACYLFPKVNRCAPGDPFGLDQQQQMQAFAAYRPFAFAMPWYQKLCNGVTLLALLWLLLLATWLGAHEIKTWVDKAKRKP